MDINAIIDQAYSLAQTHPYLGLAIILFLLSFLSKNKVLDYLLWFLAALALLKEFSLFGTFVDFIKGLPDKIGSLLNIIGGV